MAVTQALGNTGSIHGHVAAAHNRHIVEVLEGGVVIIAVGLHEVGAGENLVGGVDAEEVFARDVQELGQAGTGTDVDSLKTVFKELVNGFALADDGVVDDFDAHGNEIVDFHLDDLLGETELGDAVNQHAAAFVEGFEDGDIITHFAKIACAGQPGGTGADHRHTMSVRGRNGNRGLVLFGIVIVSNEAFKPADGNTLALFATDAFAFALLLLGADTPADSREGVSGGEDVVGGVKITLNNLGDELGDADRNRAAGAAEGVFAVQATVCLGNGLLFGIAQGDLIKVFCTDDGILLGHGVLFQTHISH